MTTCHCQGREHLVCKPGKWRIEAKVPSLTRGASMTTHKFLTIGEAVAQGLVVQPVGYFADLRRGAHEQAA